MTDSPAERRNGPLSPLGVTIVLVTILVDQATKFLAERSLPFGVEIDLLPFLSLYRIHNAGIAFSMLRDFGGLGLVALSVTITVAVLAFWWRSADGGRLAAAGYALIVGGALGNLLDRLQHGHVVDFLLLHFGDWTLFVFNLADVALSVGPALLIAAFLWPREA